MMHLLPLPVLLLTSTTSAFTLFPRQDTSSACPSVWKTVASELRTTFSGCGRDAHGAIRAPFHDCVNNGCDGSLILTDECSRAENAGLPGICSKLKGWKDKYSVSAADMIQFAAAVAISSCPLGPTVRALVGRNDSSIAATLNSVPSSREPVDAILAKFSAKGFSAEDVVALLGTHSVAVQFNDDPSQAGKSLDSTPAVYDTKFYTETKEGKAPYSLQSDRLMSNDSKTAGAWDRFGKSSNDWANKFTDAWNRFAVIGNDVGSLKDCSGVVTGGSSKSKRNMMAMGARYQKYAKYHP